MYDVLHFERLSVREKCAANGRTFGTIDVQKNIGMEVHYSLKLANRVDGVV